MVEIRDQYMLSLLTTLKAGGAAEYFATATSLNELVVLSSYALNERLPLTVLGAGSNVLPSDDGVPGLVVLNRCQKIQVSSDGEVYAETGCLFQELFLKTVQAGLAGLEYAVGIPGTLGGALVSNAGAYRSSVSEFVTELEIVANGERKWVEPAWMEFKYRDSILRRPSPPQAVVLAVRMKIPQGTPKVAYDEARDYQRQRISKQPSPASAGSFFKNIYDSTLAESLTNLPERLKKAKVVPAGYLLEQVGMAGYRHHAAMFSMRHANFMLNVGGATATAIRELSCIARNRVKDRFGVELEEEVLYLGDWSRFSSVV